MKKIFGFALVALAVILAIGCGGGDGNTPPNTVDSVSVSCNQSTVDIGTEIQCTATVRGTGDFSRTVNWTTSAGSINATGLYAAPPTIPNPATITVKATSQQNSAKFDEATLTITNSNANKIVFWQVGPCGIQCEEIWKMNPDGTGAQQLTNNSAQDIEPSWNQAHAKIAFVRELESGSQIFTMNANGSGQTQINNGSNYSRWPAFSPDGTKIAFIGRFGNEIGLALMNIDGTGVTQLTHEPCVGSCLIPAKPTWSPDGTMIAYQTPRNGNYEIYVVSVAGGTAVNITNNGASDERPAWSPDGTKLVFASDRESPGEFRIFKMNADGSNPTRVGDPGYDPAWSSDGTKLVYVKTSAGIGILTVLNSNGSQTDIPFTSNRGFPAWK